MAVKISVHQAKRNLMRRMNRLGIYEAERIAEQFREYAIARRFAEGHGIQWLADYRGQAWDASRMEDAVRKRTRIKA